MAPSEVGNEAPQGFSSHAQEGRNARQDHAGREPALLGEGVSGDISRGHLGLADVAVRTIYMHFPSKAAILLDHFDRWLDALVDGILRQPIDTPIADAVETALAEMSS